jgi:dienelactone hydrolase
LLGVGLVRFYQRRHRQGSTSVLVCTGADDPLVPPEQVVAFEEEMRAAGAQDWQVISYGNTLHGFTNPAADGSILPAALYNERSNRRSWAAMQSFFDEMFRRP